MHIRHRPLNTCFANDTDTVAGHFHSKWVNDKDMKWTQTQLELREICVYLYLCQFYQYKALRFVNYIGCIITMETISENGYIPGCRHLVWVQVYEYIGFCFLSFYIPPQVQFGQSVVFAYLFCMLQMAGITQFDGTRNLFVCIALFTTIVPSVQILCCIMSTYTKDVMVVCGCMYMAKEILLLIPVRGSLTHRSSNAQLLYGKGSIAMVAVWLLTGIILHSFFMDEYSEQTMMEKILFIIHYTPLFWISNANTQLRVRDLARIG